MGQDVANKRERKRTAAHIVAKSYPIASCIRMRRYGSLIKINPSVFEEFHTIMFCGLAYSSSTSVIFSMKNYAEIWDFVTIYSFSRDTRQFKKVKFMLVRNCFKL